MAIEVKEIKRVFSYNNEKLVDPNPEMSPNEVLDFYANTHPELTTAQAVEKETEGDTVTFEFTVVKGTKG